MVEPLEPAEPLATEPDAMKRCTDAVANDQGDAEDQQADCLIR